VSAPAYCDKQISLTGKRNGSSDVGGAPALGNERRTAIDHLVPDPTGSIVIRIVGGDEPASKTACEVLDGICGD
jgi:hypothetical protein